MGCALREGIRRSNYGLEDESGGWRCVRLQRRAGSSPSSVWANLICWRFSPRRMIGSENCELLAAGSVYVAGVMRGMAGIFWGVSFCVIRVLMKREAKGGRRRRNINCV